MLLSIVLWRITTVLTELSSLNFLLFKQFDIQAYDLGFPNPRSVSGQVTLNINRNTFAPEITNLDQSLQINEDASTNVEIFRVQARDNDTTEVMVV